jgi:hypothetical protein
MGEQLVMGQPTLVIERELGRPGWASRLDKVERPSG